MVEDIKFTGVAKEGRHYTDEGIYTVTVKNQATGDSITKRVYVGESSVLKAHMVTGISISEINECLAAGAYIDENGNIVEPTSVPTEKPLETDVEGMAKEEPISELEQLVDNSKESEAVSKKVNTTNVSAESAENNEVSSSESVFLILVLSVIVLGFAVVSSKKRDRIKKGADSE